MTVAGEQDEQRRFATRRAHGLLLLGAVVGVVLAATAMLQGSTSKLARPAATAPRAKVPEPLPAEAVARVNGRLILYRDFEGVLALGVAGGGASNTAAKQRVLEQMIDEELRVQRALELGLHLADARVRMDLASAVAEAVVAKAEREAPAEAELRDYFAERRDYFAERGPLRVRQVWVAIVGGNLGEAFGRARTAAQLLREKEEFATVKRFFGSSDPRPIPDRLLHPDDLAEYIGPMALNTVLTQQPGEISEPVRTIDGFHVLQVLERQANEAESFEDSRLAVEAEYWRELAQRALATNAAELREAADIQRVEAF